MPRPLPRRLRPLYALLILVPVAAILLFATLRPDAWRPRIEAAVLQRTGGVLALNGPLTLGLVPLHVTARDVSFANVQGGSRPEIVRAASLRADIAVLPLLSGHLRVTRLILIRPDILLETDAAGRGNWRLAPPARPAVASPGQPSAVPLPARPYRPMEIPALRIEDGALTFRDGRTGTSARFDIPRLDTAAASPDGPVSFSTQTAYAGLPFAIAGTLGPPAHLADASAPWPFALSLTAQPEKTTLTLAGSIAHPLDLSGIDAALSARVADLRALGPRLPGLTTLRFDGRIADGDGGIAKTLAVKAARLATDQGDLSGDAVLRFGHPFAVQGSLTSDRIDAAALSAAFASLRPSSAPSTPQPLAPSPGAPPGPSPTDILPFGALTGWNADLDLHLGTLLAHGASYRMIALHLLVRDGRLSAEPFSAETPAGTVQGALQIDAAATPPTTSLVLHAPQLALGPTLAALGLPAEAEGALELDAALRAAGDTPRRLVAGLDGHLGLALVNGTVGNRLILALANDLRAGGLGPDLLPARGQTAVRCLALRLDAAHGEATLRALALDTTRLRLTGTGTADLDTGTLALRLRPLIRIAGSGLVVPLRVDGPWNAPRVTPDAQPAAAPAADAGEDACPPALSLARDGRPGPLPPPEKARPDLLKNLFR